MDAVNYRSNKTKMPQFEAHWRVIYFAVRPLFITFELKIDF
jgi:hypothetical protein